MQRLAILALLCTCLSVSPAAAVSRLGSSNHHRVQTGLASYYGPGFNGDPTASGETFNQNKLVAAHRSLPLGSVVRVTNLENGRSVVVRIVDRGPYGPNRRKGCIIDVSKAAARRLRFIKDGIVHVKVRVLRIGHKDRNPAGQGR
ncbi:MAG TPA: septal ring lytic transglycosylase RlpA family protein [Vicinamibacterales bacterium]|nr:septal ring lytic transglycosylase RlpA family protein [Vicinamibacterales bacterium]